MTKKQAMLIRILYVVLGIIEIIGTIAFLSGLVAGFVAGHWVMFWSGLATVIFTQFCFLFITIFRLSEMD